MRREATCCLTNLLWQLSDLINLKYMSNVVRHRDGPDDNMNDINDTRNGLLLANHLHVPFRASDIAFLKVCCYFHPGLFGNLSISDAKLWFECC